jgi:hypothetical protein
MRTLIIDGFSADDAAAAAVRAAVGVVLPDADVLTARELKLGNCSGDFACWIRSPGRCTADHGNGGVAARMMAADRMVWLTPVTFGGYSGQLKRIIEHLIPNISPFFKQIGGETHHRPRYRSYPDLVVIGWLPTPDARAEAVFAHQVARNGINFYAERARCDVVVGEVAPERLVERIRAVVDDAQGAAASPAAAPGAAVPVQVLPVQVLPVASPTAGLPRPPGAPSCSPVARGRRPATPTFSAGTWRRAWSNEGWRSSSFRSTPRWARPPGAGPC